MARQVLFAMRRHGLMLLATLSLAVLCLAPLAASAQAPVAWERAEIQLWPEFDRPDTLVILDGWLPAATPLPAVLNVRLPAAAAEPHAVAVRTAAGDLLTAVYTTTPAEDDIIVTFTTDQLSFRIEYYDPAVTKTGTTRALTFTWTSAYVVNAVSLRVQEPVGASGLSGSPVLLALGPGGDGLNYFQRDFGALPAGGQVALSLSYTKASSTLTAGALGSNAAAAGSETAAPANTNLPIILGGSALGLALLGLGVFIYLRGQGFAPRNRRSAKAGPAARAAHRPAASRRRHAAAPQPAPSASRLPGARRTERAPAVHPAPRPSPEPVATSAPNGQTFCTRCGQRLQADDRFCRQCGAPIAPV